MEKTNTAITYINYFVPENSMSIDDLLSDVDEDKIPTAFDSKSSYKTFVNDVLKIDEIRVNDDDDEEMLYSIVDHMIDEDIVEPEEIDIILLAQEYDQRQKENIGQFIQDEFDMENAFIINVTGNYCANLDHAVNLANELLNSNTRFNNILILGSVSITDPNDRIVGTYGVLADGAGVILMQKYKSGPRLIETSIISNGAFHDVDLNVDNSLVHCKYYIKCMSDLLTNANISADRIDQVIIQNANSLMVSQCIASLDIDNSKIFNDNLTKYGHLDCLDFLVNLKDVLEKIPKSNDSYIMTFGTGWAGTYIASLFLNPTD